MKLQYLKSSWKTGLEKLATLLHHVDIASRKSEKPLQQTVKVKVHVVTFHYFEYLVSDASRYHAVSVEIKFWFIVHTLSYLARWIRESPQGGRGKSDCHTPNMLPTHTEAFMSIFFPLLMFNIHPIKSMWTNKSYRAIFVFMPIKKV